MVYGYDLTPNFINADVLIAHRTLMCYFMYYVMYILGRSVEMNALTYTYTRQHFADVMRGVNDDHTPVVVTSQRGKPVVIMSLDDYQSLEETAYLLRNPAGAKRLLESVEELRNGGGVVRELINDD